MISRGTELPVQGRAASLTVITINTQVDISGFVIKKDLTTRLTQQTGSTQVRTGKKDFRT